MTWKELIPVFSPFELFPIYWLYLCFSSVIQEFTVGFILRSLGISFYSHDWFLSHPWSTETRQERQNQLGRTIPGDTRSNARGKVTAGVQRGRFDAAAETAKRAASFEVFWTVLRRSLCQSQQEGNAVSLITCVSFKSEHSVKLFLNMEDIIVLWKTMIGQIKNGIYMALEKWLKTKVLLTVKQSQ